MSLRLHQIVLYSREKEKLSAFLSGLLEGRPERFDKAIHIQYTSFTFIIVDRENGQENGPHTSTSLHFSVSNRIKLDDFYQRSQFLHYRLNCLQKISPITQEERRDNGRHHLRYFFEIKDFDGRLWELSYFEKGRERERPEIYP